MRQLGVAFCGLLLMQSCAPMALRAADYPQVRSVQAPQPVSAVTKDTPPDAVVVPEGCTLYGVRYSELQRVGLQQAQENCRQLDEYFDTSIGLFVALLGAAAFVFWYVVDVFIQALSRG